MGRIKAVLSIKDQDYVDAFIRAVSLESGGFTFYISDGENEKNFDADLVIADYENDTLLKTHSFSSASQKCLNVYMSVRYEDESLFEEPYILYKYDEAGIIISKLRFLLGLGPFVDESREKCLTISVISEEGGIGTSTFALGLAKMLDVVFDKKSLYVSLSPVNRCKSFGNIFEEKEEYEISFSKAVYGLKVKKAIPVSAVIAEKDGLRFFKTPVFSRHAESFSLDVSNSLCRLAAKEGYKFIIYDIGNHFGRNTIEIANNCDKIIRFHGKKYLNPESLFGFNLNPDIHVLTAEYAYIDSQCYDGFYVPRCREGNFYGFENDYGLELNRVAAMLGGLA